MHSGNAVGEPRANSFADLDFRGLARSREDDIDRRDPASDLRQCPFKLCDLGEQQMVRLRHTGGAERNPDLRLTSKSCPSTWWHTASKEQRIATTIEILMMLDALHNSPSQSYTL